MLSIGKLFEYSDQGNAGPGEISSFVDSMTCFDIDFIWKIPIAVVISDSFSRLYFDGLQHDCGSSLRPISAGIRPETMCMHDWCPNTMFFKTT